MIGIIGGTGIYDPKIFKTVKEVEVKTKWGSPSDKIRIAKISGAKIAFLPRHGTKHTIPPHLVNYRANIAALKSLSVDRIIGLTAVGSLRKEIHAGDIVIPDQFLDFTKQRKSTFYEDKVVHISVADPFCTEMIKITCNVIEKMKIKLHKTGTYVCIEGPRFSSRAESKLWRLMNADIIGMTLVPEVVLAREAEICYLSISSVTDYDVWAEKPVTLKEIIERMKMNTLNVQKILSELIPKIPAERTCECKNALKDAGI